MYGTNYQNGYNKISKIEEDIRISKIKDLEKIRNELSQKLDSINENVKILKRGKSYSAINEKVIEKPNRRFLEESPEELREKQIIAMEFIEKMKNEKEMFEQQKEERHRKYLEKQQKELLEMEEKSKQKLLEIQEKHKKEIIKMSEKIRLKRDQQHKLWEKVKKNPIPEENSYIHKKLENKYEKEFLLPLLEKRKEELKNRRNYFKGVTIEELEQHAKNCEKILNEREIQKKKELESKKKEEKIFIEDQKKFKTKISIKVKKLDEKIKNAKYEQWLKRKKLHQKMESYADIVKEVSKIKTSEKKAQELKTIIENSRQPVRQTRDVKKEYSLANLNLPTRKKIGDLKRKKIQHSNSFVEYAPQIPKRINYLIDLHKKRQQYYNGNIIKKYNWKSDLTNSMLSPEQRYDNVVKKANKIEEDARMKEKLINISGGNIENIKEGEQVAELFLNAIKAKLAVLDQL